MKLGRLQRVDVRLAWANEATAFTPWLAQPENLLLLGDAIGMDLELEAQERYVGPFRADLLCRDAARGRFVLIENQLERTDHAHLGQLITYAAGLDAVAIVWIAQRITEEHRAALDWLNSITSEGVTFFGLELELWQIGDSSLAPKFNLVSKPNEWVRDVSLLTRNERSPLGEMQLEFWAGLNAAMEEIAPSVRPRKPAPQGWLEFSIGRSYFTIYVSLNSLKRSLGVGLGIMGDNAKAFFDELEQDRLAIEREFGPGLIWDRMNDKKMSYIGARLEEEDYRDRSRWSSQHKWMSEQIARFDSVFRHRVRGLIGGSTDPDSLADSSSPL
jgi:hypothetical protein